MNRAPRCVKRLFHGGLMGGVGKVINGDARQARGQVKPIRERNCLTMRVEG